MMDDNSKPDAMAKASDQAEPTLREVMDMVKGLQAKLGDVPNSESVGKMVADQFAQRQASQAASDERGRFLADKMKDVPRAYHGKLGDDPAKFDEQEQAIRKELQADLKAMGIKAPNVGDPATLGSGGKIADVMTTNKASAYQNIMAGLSERPRTGVPADVS